MQESQSLMWSDITVEQRHFTTPSTFPRVQDPSTSSYLLPPRSTLCSSVIPVAASAPPAPAPGLFSSSLHHDSSAGGPKPRRTLCHSDLRACSLLQPLPEWVWPSWKTTWRDSLLKQREEGRFLCSSTNKNSTEDSGTSKFSHIDYFCITTYMFYKSIRPQNKTNVLHIKRNLCGAWPSDIL